MKLFLLRVWGAFYGSYWFIPATMAFVSAGLAFATVWLDLVWHETWPMAIQWLFLSQPDGARAVLQTIAGSMITVAGVTFSITIATVAQASGQFGPRLMTNFMQDTGNQITLGTFIATFIYCLIVLRTVQGTDGDGGGMFVPNISISLAMLLAMASLGVLIYFFQHIPESIHVSMMVSGAGRQLRLLLDELYPARLGAAADRDAVEEAYAAGEGALEDTAPVFSATWGYVQTMDADAILAAAKRADLVIWVVARPGTFVDPNVPLAYVKPAERLDAALARSVRAGYIIGRKRTPNQDVLFLVDQLFEVAAKALSPGINDPVTAMTCVDWLTSALIELAGRDIPSPCRHDDKGALRVIAQPITFAQFAAAIYDPLRPYIETDRNAAIHMMDSIARVAYHLRDGAQARLLLGFAEALNAGCADQLAHRDDREAVADRLAIVADRLDPLLRPAV